MALVRTDISEELGASFIRVTRIGELGTLAVTRHRRMLRRKGVRRLLVKANVVPSSPILLTLMMEALSSSEMSVLTRTIWCKSQKTAFFILTAVETSNPTTFTTSESFLSEGHSKTNYFPYLSHVDVLSK
jgi:hypothetical protein